MPEGVLIGLGLLVAAAVVLAPLWSRTQAGGVDAEVGEADAAILRHRVALEALRDLEADHVAGSLDDETYAAQRAEAEAQVVRTRAALAAQAEPPERRSDPRVRRGAVMAAALIGAVLVGGSFVEASGIPNATIVNQPLADAQAAESARQDRIADLLAALDEDPTDTTTLSDLADAYLAGSTHDDLVRAAVSLQVLIGIEPDRAEAYERLMTAYLRAGDYTDARSVHDSYAKLDSADPVEVAFFDGIIALRGEDDPERAAKAFDRFLQLAPDDPRASMIRGLREEATGD